MKIKGNEATREVMIDGHWLNPLPSQLVWNHSPDGFNWGYGGSGPAQLALAILMAAGIESEIAVKFHQNFKWDHVSQWHGNFEIEIDVEAWIRNRRDVRCD